MGDKDCHILPLDKIFDIEAFKLALDNLGLPVIPVAGCNIVGLVLYHFQDLLVMSQKVFQVADKGHDFVHLPLELVYLQVGKPLKLHIHNSLGLDVIKAEPLAECCLCIGHIA